MWWWCALAASSYVMFFNVCHPTRLHITPPQLVIAIPSIDSMLCGGCSDECAAATVWWWCVCTWAVWWETTARYFSLLRRCIIPTSDRCITTRCCLSTHVVGRAGVVLYASKCNVIVCERRYLHDCGPCIGAMLEVACHLTSLCGGMLPFLNLCVGCSRWQQ